MWDKEEQLNPMAFTVPSKEVGVMQSVPIKKYEIISPWKTVLSELLKMGKPLRSKVVIGVSSL